MEKKKNAATPPLTTHVLASGAATGGVHRVEAGCASRGGVGATLLAALDTALQGGRWEGAGASGVHLLGGASTSCGQQAWACRGYSPASLTVATWHPPPCTSRPAVLQPYFPFSHRLTATAGRQPVPLSAALAASVHAAMLAINRAREAGAGGAVQRKLPPAVVCAGGAAVEPRAAPAVAVRALRGGVRKQAEP